MRFAGIKPGDIVRVHDGLAYLAEIIGRDGAQVRGVGARRGSSEGPHAQLTPQRLGPLVAVAIGRSERNVRVGHRAGRRGMHSIPILIVLSRWLVGVTLSRCVWMDMHRSPITR